MAKTRKAASWPPSPPENESEEQRLKRLAAEAEARKISESIDRSIEMERRKRRKCIKLLLLGQSESGKSTILKNLQIYLSPSVFEAEAVVWRPIIHLNLVRSVNFILNLLSTTASEPNTIPMPLSSELRRLMIFLAPLREVELSLVQGIPGSVDLSSPNTTLSYNPTKASEVALSSGTGWKSFLSTRRDSGEIGDTKWEKDNDSTRRILEACTEDMMRLWKNAGVHKVLKEHGISLPDQSGFFLDDLPRITREDYVPNFNDILRARVRTVGPQEHQIHLEKASEHAKLWKVYDMGGSRTERATWAQFFDDVNVIIFLAPLSGFDQMLEEDDTVNRLTDSLKLWEMISSNRILQSVELILFLNKLDILDAKLKSGIQFKEYVPEYKGVNETKPVAKHVVDTFFTLHRKSAPKKRKMHTHLTCAIDIKATARIIDRVYQVVMVKYLEQNTLI